MVQNGANKMLVKLKEFGDTSAIVNMCRKFGGGSIMLATTKKLSGQGDREYSFVIISYKINVCVKIKRLVVYI